MTPEKEPQVYVGPALRAPLSLPRFTVFAGGTPPEVEALARRTPALRALIVPVSRLAEASKAVRQKGSLLHLYFTQLQKSF